MAEISDQGLALCRPVPAVVNLVLLLHLLTSSCGCRMFVTCFVPCSFVGLCLAGLWSVAFLGLHPLTPPQDIGLTAALMQAAHDGVP